MLVALGGGMWTLICALTNSPRIYDDPRVKRQIETIGKPLTVLLHSLAGLALIGVGIWLGYGIFFVPQ